MNQINNIMARGVGFGKIIFLGEHFVVYGCKAIGFGLNKKIVVEAKKSARNIFNFKADEKINKIASILKKRLKIDGFKLKIIKSELPWASGLGSSAALSVAIIRALIKEFSISITDDKVCELAFECEKIFHGAPSGIDNTLATYGGAITFQKAKIERKNIIKKIILNKPLFIVVINTGIKGETAKQVKKVKIFKGKNEAIFKNFLKVENKIVKQAEILLNKGDYEPLGDLIDVNHDLLRALGISRPENEEVVNLARSAGALGAKLVGAGGGGSCLALAKNKTSAQKIIKSLNNKYDAFIVRVVSQN